MDFDCDFRFLFAGERRRLFDLDCDFRFLAGERRRLVDRDRDRELRFLAGERRRLVDLDRVFRFLAGERDLVFLKIPSDFAFVVNRLLVVVVFRLDCEFFEFGSNWITGSNDIRRRATRVLTSAKLSVIVCSISVISLFNGKISIAIKIIALFITRK